MQAAKYIEYDTSFGEEEKKKAKALKVTCNLNNAACKLKLKDYKEAQKLCTKVVSMDMIENTTDTQIYRGNFSLINFLQLETSVAPPSLLTFKHQCTGPRH